MKIKQSWLGEFFKMHELFNKVLAKRDLSRAGDLFSVPDADIVDDITEVVSCPLLLSWNRI